jgi:hypothetical protein
MSLTDVRRALDNGLASEPIVRSDSAAVLAARSAGQTAVLDASDAFESVRAVVNMITSA